MSQAQTCTVSHLAAAPVGRDFLAAGRNLWLAGLGAVAEAEEETRRLFDRLVERGRPVEERRKRAADAVSARTGQTLRGIRKLLQETVEYETQRALKRRGLATRDDFKALSARLDVLASNVDDLAARWRIEQSLAAAQPATAKKETR